jgi:LysR family transcriptional regulator, glycine cleavage system transcriptional activator
VRCCQGVALVRDIYVREEIAAGRLCVALDCPQPTRFAYYAVTKPEAMQRPAVRAFVEWLSDEARASSEP